MLSTSVCLVFLGVVIIHIGLFDVTCSVVLSASPAIAIDGESVTLTCTYSGSEGVTGFAWFLNGKTVAVFVLPECRPFARPGPPDPLFFEYACLSNNQSSFTVKRISLKQNGERWQCAAAAPGYLYSSNVTITVEVAVTNVSLQSPSGSITEHIKTTFSCKTSLSKPAANMIWYKESGSGQRQMITNEIVSATMNVGDLQMSTSILKYSPTRSDNGYEIFCTAINIDGRTPITSAKFKMLVQCKSCVS
ncbi:uncharacterized protein LOC132731689 [Ruditapes philippinarum]|uniref:uncharacterized protein LOC132731689 n=1 Tax=Ruditapes philippinarum TaxID=129788 RepID=UPI00295AD9DC|nr:uncharacterized protein LOC132731689 [Ruditapes philippinarum]